MADKKKKKILWVVYSFVQAGGERYVYEICKALNKERFQVDILHLNPLGTEKAWTNEYYYQPSIEAGCSIFALNEIIGKNRIAKKTFVQRTIHFFIKKMGKSINHSLSQNEFLTRFLLEYNYVNFSGTAVYRNLCIERGIELKNAIIHILTAQFQLNRSLYEGFDKSLPYHFVSSIPENSQRKDLNEFENYQLSYFPLCFETRPYKINKPNAKKDEYRIAVFTRLSAMKPLDPYFYALKLLLEQDVNVVLDIYGAGDPETLGLIRQLNYLYISDRVFFKGHTESIETTLKGGDIDLVWFQSNNSVPAGYAALEICMSGIAQIFWDFAKIQDDEELDNVFPSFTSILKFVEFSKSLLINEELHNNLGDKQRKYVVDHNSSKIHIGILENAYKN